MRPPTLVATRRAAGRALAVAATAGSMIVLGVAASPASGSARAANVPACKPSQLVVWLNTQSNGAAGTIFYKLNFTNAGARCTLRGFPGVSAVGGHGNQLGAAATRNNVTKVKTVILNAANPAQGTFSTAHALLGIAEASFFPAGSCRPTIAFGLRVFPPNQSASELTQFPFATCSSGSMSVLRIAAVTR